MVAALAAPVGGHLFVGEHGAERGAPVDRCLVEVCEPVRVDDRAAGVAVELAPRLRLGVGPTLGRSAAVLELLEELGDRPGPVLVVVVPGAVELQEDPLRPPVVVAVGGGDAAPRVVAEPQRSELAAHVGDVGFGSGSRVLAGLHRVLLGGQAEGVVAHGVQDVVASHAHEPGVDVGADVAEGVADVQAGAARVREHVEHVELAAVGDLGEPARQRAGGVGRPEGAPGVPAVLPLRFDPVRERGVVAKRGRFGRGGRGLGHARASVPGRDRALPHRCSYPFLGAVGRRPTSFTDACEQ